MARALARMKPIPQPLLFPRLVEWLLGGVTLLSVIAYVLEVEFGGSSNSVEGRPIWLWLERFVSIVLTSEYFARWRREGRTYPKSILGAIDLVSVLPFWLGFFVPVEWLGIVRSLRILRLLKLYRYSRAMRVFVHALFKTRRYLTGMFFIVVVLILFGAVGIHEIEKTAQPDSFGSLFDSIWWKIVALMSVGYGDAVPVTGLGKLFAQFLMVVGVGLMAAFIGIVGSVVYAEVGVLDRYRKQEEDI